MSSVTDGSLDFLFHPRSIALVGITTANPRHWTRSYLDAALDFEFDGPLYLVNPKGGEINGHRVYPSLKDIPQTVDYVIGLVPARASVDLVEECAAKGVRAVHFCTAGFSETGEEEGTRLETELIELARRHGIRVVGPNCMGLYCPRSRLSFGTVFPRESGPVGIISQSGGNANYLIRQAALRGVRFSKVASYGNARDLDESDFLEYLTEDADTRVIAMYIEGVKDGKRFRRALEKAVRRKPVILLKGGRTEAGIRAVAGHTSALAGSEASWEALRKQLGLIRVDSLDEMVDVFVTLLFMDKPKGRNAVIMGSGGGASVLITDVFEKRGLKVPPLPDEIIGRLREFTQIAGNILRNPVDYSQSMGNSENVARTIEIITGWEGIDFLVWFLRTGQSHQGGGLKNSPVMLEGAFPAGASSKPLAAVLEPSVLPLESGGIYDLLQQYVALGLPVYYSFDSAAIAIDRVLTYQEHQSA